MNKERRRKEWIDRFQTLFTLRLVLYGVFFQVIIFVLMWFTERYSTMYNGLNTGSSPAWPMLLSLSFMVALTLVLLRDAIRFTHKYVGPIVRFRRTLREIREGKPVELIRLRKGDQLQEMKDEINELLRYLEERGVLEIKPATNRSPSRQAVSV
jgi:hypothetical protein